MARRRGPQPGRRSALSFEIGERWWERVFGFFGGTVTEDTTRGMPGVGRISGRFSFPNVKFIKRMPVSCVATPEGGLVSRSQFLQEQGLTLEFEVEHSPIYHRGVFSSPISAAGTWFIPKRKILLGKGRG
jgi:hypothetical protein